MSQSPVENLVSKLQGTDKNHRKSRFSLCMEMNISDRELRQIKETAISHGEVICSSSGADGYWLGDDADRARLIGEHLSRVWSHVRTIQALKGVPLSGQMTLTELEGRLELDESV